MADEVVHFTQTLSYEVRVMHARIVHRYCSCGGEFICRGSMVGGGKKDEFYHGCEKCMRIALFDDVYPQRTIESSEIVKSGDKQ